MLKLVESSIGLLDESNVELFDLTYLSKRHTFVDVYVFISCVNFYGVCWGLVIAKRAISTVASVYFVVKLTCSCCSLFFRTPSEPIITL